MMIDELILERLRHVIVKTITEIDYRFDGSPITRDFVDVMYRDSDFIEELIKEYEYAKEAIQYREPKSIMIPSNKWYDYAKLCYEIHQESMPYLPDWDKLPSEVRSQYADEVERVSKIGLKVIIGC